MYVVSCGEWGACPGSGLHLSEIKKPKSTVPWVLIFEAKIKQGTRCCESNPDFVL